MKITELAVKTKTGKLKGFLHAAGHGSITLEIFRHDSESMDIIRRDNLMHYFKDIYCVVSIPTVSIKKEPPLYYKPGGNYKPNGSMLVRSGHNGVEVWFR